MVKGVNIILRVDEAFKTRIKNASNKKGSSMSTFITESIEKELRNSENEVFEPRQVFEGVPTFFRANCEGAKAGGDCGYDMAGYHLGLHLATLLEPQDNIDTVGDKLDKLAALLNRVHRDDQAILEWFEREFPLCMALVPKKRRRDRFLKGVYAAHDERGITDL